MKRLVRAVLRLADRRVEAQRCYNRKSCEKLEHRYKYRPSALQDLVFRFKKNDELSGVAPQA